MTLFRGFSKTNFKTTGFQLKLSISIESINIFHWKPAIKSKWVWSWGKFWTKLSPITAVMVGNDYIQNYFLL